MSADTIMELVAGALGGMAGLVVGYPFDTVKVHQQVDGTKQIPAIKKIWRAQGFRGFFRGMTVPMLTNGIVFAVFFSSYSAVLEWFTTQDGRMERLNSKSFESACTYQEVFIGGCVGGFAQTFVAGPIELLKVQMQIRGRDKSPSSYKILQKLLAVRGYQGLAIGMGSTFCRDIHSHGLYTLAYKYYLDTFCDGGTNLGCVFMAGGIAGNLYWWSCMPMDVVKSRIQADAISKPVYKGAVDCTKKVYQKEGWKGFFRGTLATSWRAFPANGVVFLVHDNARELFQQLRGNTSHGK